MKRTNRRTRYLGAAFAVLMALVLGSLAFGATAAHGEEGMVASSAAKGTNVVPGEVLVLFDDAEAAELSVDAADGGAQALSLDGEGERSEEDANAAEVPADAPAEEAAPAIVEGFEVEDAEVIASDVDGQTIVSLELADDGETDALIDALDAIDGVTAQPNYVYQLLDDGTPSDPLVDDKHLGLQYFLGPLGDGTNDSGANIFAAWELFTEVDNPASVTVGVLDTGIEPTHPDLQDNVRYDLAYNVVEDSPVMYDNEGHGTHVTGTIAATTNNTTGVAGAASGAFVSLTGPRVSVVPVNIFPEDPSEGTDTINIVKGLDYLRDLVESGKISNLRVVNLSLGVYADSGDDFDPAMKRAIDDLTAKGVLCVAAGGNGDGVNTPYTTPMFPSDYAPVLSVTSLTEQGANSTFSDYNQNKDISAPGEEIASTTTDGIYAYSSGTSMASPIVSSVVALMASANPALTPAELHDIVRETAVALPSDENSHAGQTGSAGAIDARAALAEAIARAGQKPSDGTVSVYRLYNRWTGEHLLTASKDEFVDLRLDNYGAWLADGVCFTVLPADSTEGRPIYRVYNPYNGDHFYTESDAEAENLASQGWRREGIAWRAASSSEGLPVYRLYNPYMRANGGLGNHLWTTSTRENANLSSQGWISESAAWRAVR